MFTSSVILKLVADGKMNLDDLATKHLPTTGGLTGMTVRQVLSHSAGLYDYSFPFGLGARGVGAGLTVLGLCILNPSAQTDFSQQKR